MTTHLTGWETLLTAAALAAGIMLTRFSPFLLFSRKKDLPNVIRYLGGALPHASMTMLLVYCLKDASLVAPPHGMPEGLALLFTAAVHTWKRNALLSIAGGTLCHMALAQYVF